MNERFIKIEEKIDGHLQQYAQNGKELMRLAMAVEMITKEVRDHHKFSEDNKKIREKEEQTFREELKPLLDSYYAIMSGRKIIIGLAITASAVGSAYLALKSLIHR